MTCQITYRKLWRKYYVARKCFVMAWNNTKKIFNLEKLIANNNQKSLFIETKLSFRSIRFYTRKQFYRVKTYSDEQFKTVILKYSEFRFQKFGRYQKIGTEHWRWETSEYLKCWILQQYNNSKKMLKFGRTF